MSFLVDDFPVTVKQLLFPGIQKRSHLRPFKYKSLISQTLDLRSGGNTNRKCVADLNLSVLTITEF